MKRLVRSCLDPLPRSISTKSLSLLVGMLLLGIGISVREYLESRRVPERTVPVSSPFVPEECTRGEHCRPCATKPDVDLEAPAPAGETGARLPTPKSAPAASVRTGAPTEWVPEPDAQSGFGGSRSSSASER